MEILGTESASQITKDSALISRCKELRGKAAQLIGMCEDWKKVDDQSPGLPFVVLVGHTGTNHKVADLNARLIFANACHDTMAGTAAVCLAACSREQGTVVSGELADGALRKDTLRIGHPEGAMSVLVKATAVTTGPHVDQFDILAFERTARRIMTGTVFIPKQVWSGLSPGVRQMVPKKTSLLMTGDINLLDVEDATGPFKKVAHSLAAADIVISNLECMLDTRLKSTLSNTKASTLTPMLELRPSATARSPSWESPTTSTMAPPTSLVLSLPWTKPAYLIQVQASTLPLLESRSLSSEGAADMDSFNAPRCTGRQTTPPMPQGPAWPRCPVIHLTRS